MKVVLIVVISLFLCMGVGSVATIAGLTILGQSLNSSFEEIERSVPQPP